MANEYVAMCFVKGRELDTRLTQTERDRCSAESRGALDPASACKSSREGSNALPASGHFKSKNTINGSEMNHTH